MARIVIALGGNALGSTPAEQRDRVAAACPALVGLIHQGHEIIISHGNGPQVGMIQAAFDTAAKTNPKVAPMPLPECTAMSQGYIGYHLQQGMRRTLRANGMPWQVATVVTQVVVDPDDPAFGEPTKPIGAFYDEAAAQQMMRDDLFIANDTYLDNNKKRVSIITGPNMAGKSTYMRQVALIVLMAQMGSFVPAKYAHIGVVDRIFTRIGASDDLSAGQSTFMVEMTEVSDILHAATKDSLLILDEIGRGTSTFDGMSIARAVLEYCADPKKLGAKTLFATHYHELTALEGQIPGVKNYNIAAKKRGSEVIFLRKIVRGGADQSYGVEVAKLAGVPERVVRRARNILQELEEKGCVRVETAAAPQEQISLMDLGGQTVLQKLRMTDVNILSPIEALNLLAELKQDLQES